MKRIYTFNKHGKSYICTKSQMIKILAEEIYYDTTYCNGFGIDVANYKRGKQEADKLARKCSGLIACDTGYTFTVYNEDRFNRFSEEFKNKFIDIRRKQL